MVLASGDARVRNSWPVRPSTKKCGAKMAKIKHGASQSCPDDGSDSDRPFSDPDGSDMNLLFSDGSPHSDESEVCREWDLCRVFKSCPFCRECWTNQLCMCFGLGGSP